MGGRRITDEEIVEISHLVELDYNVSEIARELNRDRQSVAKIVRKLKPTGKAARTFLEAELLSLTRKMIEEMKPDHVLEVLDRTDALPKKRDQSGHGSQLIVCVGMPGQPALSPPTAEQLAGVTVAVPVKVLEAEKVPS